MPRKKKEQEERWGTAKEVIAVLNKNSDRDDIAVPYVRQLVRAGKLTKKEEGLDGRTALYRLNDIADYVVERRDKGKGDTVAARKAGSRRKSNKKTEEASTLLP